LVGDGVPVNSEVILVTDFVNLKIKQTQSFKGAHKGRIYSNVFYCVLTLGMCTSVFIGLSYQPYMNFLAPVQQAFHSDFLDKCVPLATQTPQGARAAWFRAIPH
jgi:hypothetical protein